MLREYRLIGFILYMMFVFYVSTGVCVDVQQHVSTCGVNTEAASE